MARPRPKFKPGDGVKISSQYEQYEGFHDRVLMVKSYHDHHCKPGQDDPTGHPGFDPGSNCCLYEMAEEDVTFALYEWELEAA